MAREDPAPASRPPAEQLRWLLQQAEVQRALRWLQENLDWVTEQQIRLTEIPAPTFQEARRARAVRNLFRSFGWSASLDSAGNVVFELAGSEPDLVLVSAHLDTVFPPGLSIRVERCGTQLRAPGIADNGAGLAGLLAVARAFRESGLRVHRTVAFAATVCEEGEGNLQGMRALMDRYRERLRAAIVLEGASEQAVITRAVASRRLEVTFRGPGGHSWADYGLPNPVHALARAIVHLLALPLASTPRATLSVTRIEGGSTINTIPAQAIMKIDARSEDEAETERLERAVRDAVERAVQEESQAARSDGASLTTRIRLLGTRPAGALPEDSPLLAALQAVDRWVGLHSRLESASTDANVPLAMGIPALALGTGGQAGAIHTVGEWYDPSGREQGLKRILMLIVLLAGVTR